MVEYDQDMGLPRRRWPKKIMINKLSAVRGGIKATQVRNEGDMAPEYVTRGKAALAAGRKEEAIECFNKALDVFSLDMNERAQISKTLESLEANQQ